MTINSAVIGTNWFLDGLSTLQSRELTTQRQLSSGYKVQSAADDPVQTRSLIDLGSSLSTAQTYQSTLSNVTAEATTADQSLSTAITLLENARSIAVQAASSIATAADRQNYSAQILGIQQQFVALANTTVNGRYIFGGDADQSPPYQLDSTSPTGVTALTSSPSTRLIVNPAGQVVYQSATAATIFDSSSAGVPTANNVFAALQSLQVALQANDQTGIGTALTSLESGSNWLNQQQVSYGAAQNLVTAEQSGTANQITAIQTQISGIRDTDITAAATDLAQETTAQSAAYGAQAEIGHKSLFDYIA